jgi:hypothetical protein
MGNQNGQNDSNQNNHESYSPAGANRNNGTAAPQQQKKGTEEKTSEGLSKTSSNSSGEGRSAQRETLDKTDKAAERDSKH